MNLEERALDIFIHAERFCEASLVIENNIAHRDDPQTLMFPSGVLASFSLELYLKCLCILESGSYPGTHDLHRLFATLKPKTQAKILEFYDNPPPSQAAVRDFFEKEGLASDLATTLKISRNAFKKMRYIFEKRSEREIEGWNAGFVIECVRQYIIDLKPDWPVRFTIRQPEGYWIRPTSRTH